MSFIPFLPWYIIRSYCKIKHIIENMIGTDVESLLFHHVVNCIIQSTYYSCWIEIERYITRFILNVIYYHYVGRKIEFRPRQKDPDSATLKTKLCLLAHLRKWRDFIGCLFLAFAVTSHEPPPLAQASRPHANYKYPLFALLPLIQFYFFWEREKSKSL